MIDKLNGEIAEHLLGDSRAAERERSARRIRLTIAGIAKKLNLSGEVKMFGSYSNGFKTGGSDLDIVFSGEVPPESVVSILSKFAKDVERYGFDNVTTIFSANVPLVKITDKKAMMEVDFCINNDLGVRNSLLLHAYCECDPRVLKVGRTIKDWAKKHELVGTADGCLNSYAYMLLALHYLQQLTPPVVPNLQMLATEPVPMTDRKWGGDDVWETQFLDDTSSLPPSENTLELGELLIGFFRYYTQEFDWRKDAVCMRRSQPGKSIDKFNLTTPTNDEQWYVEDPFDLKHNLAGKCSRIGRKRILDEMKSSLTTITNTGSLKQCFPENPLELYFLKCRISQGVTPQALLEEFEAFDLVKLHFPKPDGTNRMGQAFLEFNSSMNRRRAHTKNENYVADCQLQLHYSSQAGLAEAVNQGVFSTYEMASYKMKKQILAARVQGPGAQAGGDAIQSQPHPPYHDVPPMPMNMMPPGAYGGPPQYPYGPPPFGPRPFPGPPPPPGMPPHHQAMYAPHGFDPAMMQPKRPAVPKKAADESMPKVTGKSGEPKSKAEMKVSAAKGKAIINQPVEKTKVKAKAKVGGTGWLNVNITSDLPKDTPLFSREQAKTLEDLVVYFRQFKSTSVTGSDDHVVVQCELQNHLVHPQKVFQESQMNKVRELQKWLNASKQP